MPSTAPSYEITADYAREFLDVHIDFKLDCLLRGRLAPLSLLPGEMASQETGQSGISGRCRLYAKVPKATTLYTCHKMMTHIYATASIQASQPQTPDISCVAPRPHHRPRPASARRPPRPWVPHSAI